MNANLGVQLFPYSFRHPTTDVPLSLGTVTVTLAGTSTLVATFADAALAFANPNPLTLDPSGYGLMFFSPLNGGVDGVSYDVVVKDQAGLVQWMYEDVIVPVPTAGGNLTTAVVGAGTPPTLTIAGGSITPTRNVHLISPEGGAADFLDHIAVTNFPDGGRLTISNTNGAAPITVRNNQANIFTPDTQSIVLSVPAQRLSLIRYGASWWVDSAIGLGGAASVSTQGNLAACGRLTLQSGVPVTTGDVTGATIFYTPYNGNVIDLYDGTKWTRYTFTEVAYNGSAIGGGSVADLFAYANGSVVTLEAQGWASPTTRAVALVRQNGVLVKASDATRRYLGTISPTQTGVLVDYHSHRLVWNNYNRVRRPMLRIDPTASWEWATTGWRQANASVQNQLTVVIGLPEDAADFGVFGRVIFQTSNNTLAVAIGVDSVAAPHANCVARGGIYSGCQASLCIQIAEGLHGVTWLEYGDNLGSTWEGTGPIWRSAIYGNVWA